jgi:hypothetical protein
VGGELDAVLLARHLDDRASAYVVGRLLQDPSQRRKTRAVGHEQLPGEILRRVVHRAGRVQADHVAGLG